jgi:hypothetical protein
LLELTVFGGVVCVRCGSVSSGTNTPTAIGYECRGVVLKLHLQKHYLLKNYTSRDLEIVLDAAESFVELQPKDDGDALRMLRHADTQIASKYRSFLTFIRCEFLLLLPPKLVLADRARPLALKNLLAVESVCVTTFFFFFFSFLGFFLSFFPFPSFFSSSFLPFFFPFLLK